MQGHLSLPPQASNLCGHHNIMVIRQSGGLRAERQQQQIFGGRTDEESARSRLARALRDHDWKKCEPKVLVLICSFSFRKKQNTIMVV
jgi:hypothetical protein